MAFAVNADGVEGLPPHAPEVSDGERGSPITFVPMMGGSPAVVSLQATQLLRSADVVVHGSSLARFLEFFAPRSACHVFMRAEAADATMETAVLIALARQGHSVVRLQTGDPDGEKGAAEYTALGTARVPFAIAAMPRPRLVAIDASTWAAEVPVASWLDGDPLAATQGPNPRNDVATILAQSDALIGIVPTADVASVRRQLMAAGRPPDQVCGLVSRHAAAPVWSQLSEVRSDPATLRHRGSVTVLILGWIGTARRLVPFVRTLTASHPSTSSRSRRPPALVSR